MCQQHDLELTDGGSLKIFFDVGLCSDSLTNEQTVVKTLTDPLCCDEDDDEFYQSECRR